jgi:hypothetical protein
MGFLLQNKTKNPKLSRPKPGHVSVATSDQIPSPNPSRTHLEHSYNNTTQLKFHFSACLSPDTLPAEKPLVAEQPLGVEESPPLTQISG